ncbi:NUDIX hydrolase domain-like [Ostreococcus tauri]|uniref:NUDIX hydrolase domain-like n=1 Tax=Ostreococcus tauri TaxID=70448 RepID=A0A090M371_OSTTA|nr:NUDIX hydrolase domain-like [Ostreococcus tauri]CEF97117.1 NUDIX hydrolase domain-like [Ostreococcus tauri]|eukprot:XP_022838496.1 NUDIX hydrolase domain-like [Ostreococcus tauri]
MRSSASEHRAALRDGEIVRETVVHERYFTVYDRLVEFQSDDGSTTKRFAYDVVGHPKSAFAFVCVAPFHDREVTSSGEPEFTVVREYAQGSNAECVVLPSGCYEPGKHATMEEVAVDELRQESRIAGGELFRLIERDNPGLLETKWCRNRLFPFLSVDGVACGDGEECGRDDEEFNMTHERVTVRELKKLMYSGEMMMPSVVTAQLAIDKLLAMGRLKPEDLV